MDRTIAIGYQEKLFKLILSFKENKYCADCQSLNPDWVSTTLGVFVCYKCSGIHRSFGMHITRVKSATLDTWTLKQVYVMGFVDNKLSNAYWEANLPKDFVKPTCDSAPNDLINFAKKKYLERAFAIPGHESPAEEIRSNLILTAGESEDKEEFFNTKLEELKKLLKEKVLTSSPERKISIKDRLKMDRGFKKAGTIVLHHVSERASSETPFKNFGSPVKNNVQALVSPQVHFGQKKGTAFGFNITGSPDLAPASSDLPLFQGLNVKTITTIEEERDEDINHRARFQRPFLKACTQEYNILRSPEPKSALLSSQGNSRNNLMTAPSKRKIMDYLEEEDVFEESKGPNSRCSIEEIEMQELSSISSGGGEEHKGPLLRMATMNNNAEGNMNMMNIKLLTQKTKTSEALFDAHLKRPSEEFEVPKCLSMQEIPPTRLRRIDQLWKYPVLLVCFLLHLTMGYWYSWGSISPYIASFVMNDYQDDRYTEHTNHNMMIFLGIAMGFCLSEGIAQNIGMRTLAFGSFLGLGGSILLCSLTQDVLLYSGLLTIVAGFFIGLLYEIPFYCSSQYFYSHPIFLKGFFYIANGLGAFGYIYFSYSYLREGDLTGELEMPAQSTYSFYSNDVVTHVPDLLSKIGIGILIVGVVAGVLLHPRSSFIIKDYSGYREHEESLLNVTKRSSTRGRMRRKAPALLHQGLKEALISPSTKTLLSIIILYSILGSYLLCSYKYLGLLHNYSDACMSLVGGIGMILLNLGKMVGVVIHPRFEFKAMCKKIITCQIVAGFTLFLLGQAIDMAFLGLFLVIMFFDGLMFAVVIEETKFVHLEDIEDAMVALMILGYCVANFLSFMIVKPLILLELRSAIILVLTMPMFLAYKTCREYSRATTGDDSEMIADLLDVDASKDSVELLLR